MRVDPERMRRHMARERVRAAEVEFERWWEAMTPEHRANHERPWGRAVVCSICIQDAAKAMTDTLSRWAARPL